MSTSAVPAAAESGLQRFRRAFGRPGAWIICVLGFGSGLPFLLVGVTLGYWFREQGITLGSIGLFSWISLLYVGKFLWAPLLDKWAAPLIGGLGRRRSWLLLSQLGVAAGLAAMALIGPSGQNLAAFLAALTFTTFCGATQDCVVDAYRIEIAPKEDQGALITTYSLGYRIGLVLGGALALYVADLIGWPTTYLVLAALMLIPAAITLRAIEPALASAPQAARQAAPPPRGTGELVENALREYLRPISEFFERNGAKLALTLLLFVGLYKLPDQIIGVMAGPFYLDLGFTKSQIATVSKVYGVWLGFAGALLGGIAATVIGTRRSLLIAALGVALSNLVFLLMAANPGQIWAFIITISADNFCQGFAGSVLVAFMSGLADVRFSATQYALLASLSNLPGKVLGGVSGFFVEAFGFQAFFALSAVSIVPTLWLYWRLRSHMDAPPAG
ncbi:MAG: MFS transporter [Lysobacterales bacterium 69-70]|nr:MAG: signal transduction protein [Xanthomonadaceae bacterium SCN 69-320]ODV21223.1 MAG: signal transduction protein [Xanthomonadaceae bacterium SCN 69-25]OJZ00529.1 MAG: MFS transporter [Xanthomonadales bacterium 69-70]